MGKGAENHEFTKKARSKLYLPGIVLVVSPPVQATHTYSCLVWEGGFPHSHGISLYPQGLGYRKSLKWVIWIFGKIDLSIQPSGLETWTLTQQMGYSWTLGMCVHLALTIPSANSMDSTLQRAQ